MTPENLIKAIKPLLPDTWEVAETKKHDFIEVVAYPPTLEGRHFPGEPSLWVSNRGVGWRTSNVWHVEVNHWDDVHEYEEATWVATAEDALEYVEQVLPTLLSIVDDLIKRQDALKGSTE